MKTTTFICDECRSDLSGRDFVLEVSSRSQIKTNAQSITITAPALPFQCGHFCHVGCLLSFLDRLCGRQDKAA